jgi:MGT family glycosyltransferase
MNIAMICPEAPGHLNPMATLGCELARRGHRMSLVARPIGKWKAEGCGFELLSVGEGPQEAQRLWSGLGKAGRMSGFRAMRQTGKLLQHQASITLRDAPEKLRKAGVEAMVVDQVTLAGSALAEVLHLPFVIACNALAMHEEPRVPPSVLGWRYRPDLVGRLRNRVGHAVVKLAARPVISTISEFRRRHGLPRFRIDDIRDLGLAQVAQQPAFFDYPRVELPTHFHYTGPWHDATRDSESVPFPWDWLDGHPLIYASLGTVTWRGQMFRAILDGCAALPVQLVLSLGRKGAKWDGPVPPNAKVVPFAPQLTLIDRASLLITSGGFNTVLEGLRRGVPMLCIPVANDNPAVARRLEWIGVGEMLSPRLVTAARVQALVEKILAGPYRNAAQKYREQLETNPGVIRAANIVEEALRTGRRVER